MALKSERERERVKKRVKPPPDTRAKRQAVIFGANMSSFVPAALVKPPPRAKPKAGGRPSAQEHYKREVELERKRFELAKAAPVSATARLKLRETETAAERRVRIPPPPRPKPSRPVARGRTAGKAGIPTSAPLPYVDPDPPPKLIDSKELLQEHGFEYGSYLEMQQREEMRQWHERRGGQLTRVDFTPRAQTKKELQEVAERALETKLAETGIFELAEGEGSRGQRLLASLGRNFVIGPDLANALRGEDFDKKWLVADMAMLPFLFGKPVRAGRALLASKLAARSVPEAERAAVFKRTFDETMEGPTFFGQLIRQARKNKALNVPERAELHAAVDALMEDEAIAKLAKDRLDTTVHLMTRATPAGERARAVREAYGGLLEDVRAAPEPSLGAAESPPRPPGEPPLAPAAPEEPPRPPTPEDAAAIVRKAVRGSAEARKQQRYMRLEEAARRATAGEEAMLGLEGEMAIRAAKKALGGKMPQVYFGGLRDLDDETFRLMAEHITGHPGLTGMYDKINAHDGLRKMIKGEVPQPHEVTLLNRAFGKETVDSLRKERSNLRKLASAGIQLYHLPRTMMSTLDLSFGARQSLVPMPRHPRMFVRNWMKMHRQFGSQSFFEMTAREIVEDPLYPLYKRMGIAFTDLGDNIIMRDEQVISPLPEKLPGVLGAPFRASARAYTGMGNTQRRDLARAGLDRLQRYLDKRGYTIDDYPDIDHALESLGRLVNSSTGRGGAKHKATEEALKFLQYSFFSPRLLKSRLDFMNPLWYMSLHPVARREAAEQFWAMTAMLGFILGTAKMAGASVGIDPRDSDFARIKIGDTRIDILGGFQPVMRYTSQIFWQNKMAIAQLRDENWELKYEHWQDPGSTFLRFIRSKLAPMPSAIVDTQMGKDFVGEPVNVIRTAYTRMIPILATDLIDLHRNGYPKETLLPYPLALYGVSVSTYERSKTERERAEKTEFEEWQKERSVDTEFEEWKKGR
jgi:hypothetical protein